LFRCGLGGRFFSVEPDPIHVYIGGREGDLRNPDDLPDGVIAHFGPPLHPDDVEIVDGIPVTSVARTLIDLGEVMEEGELRQCFLNARDMGLLDFERFDASRARVEWRPSLALVDAIAAELR
jgi:hypothetical protein